MFEINILKSTPAAYVVKVLGVVSLAASLSSSALAGTRDDYLSVKKEVVSFSKKASYVSEVASNSRELTVLCKAIFTEFSSDAGMIPYYLKDNRLYFAGQSIKSLSLRIGDLGLEKCISNSEMIKLENEVSSISEKLAKYKVKYEKELADKLKEAKP